MLIKISQKATQPHDRERGQVTLCCPFRIHSGEVLPAPSARRRRPPMRPVTASPCASPPRWSPTLHKLDSAWPLCAFCASPWPLASLNQSPPPAHRTPSASAPQPLSSCRPCRRSGSRHALVSRAPPTSAPLCMLPVVTPVVHRGAEAVYPEPLIRSNPSDPSVPILVPLARHLLKDDDNKSILCL